MRLAVVPGHIKQRFCTFAPFSAVHFAHPVVNTRQDLTVVKRFARRILPLPVPLQPAPGVGNRTILLGKTGGGQTEHFCRNRRRVNVVHLAVVLPEAGGLGDERIDHHHVLQLAQGADNRVLIRERGHRVKALADVAGHFTLRHHVEIFDDVVGLIPLRQPVEAPVVLFLRRIAIERFHQADEELRIVAPVVHLIGQHRFRRVRRQVLLQIGLFFRRQRQVTRQAGRKQPQIRQPLNIGVTTQGVNPTAGHAHIAEQQLDHRHGADVLRTDRMLRPAQRVEERRGSVYGAGRREHLAHLQEVRFWRTADILYRFRGVAIDMLFEQVPDTARMGQRLITFRIAVVIKLVVPRRFIVLPFFSIVAAEQTLFEGKVIPHQQAGVGVVPDVFRVDLIVFDQIAQHAGEEGDIRPGADRRIDIRHRRRARKARVDNDKRRVIVVFGFHCPAETDRVGFSGVAAHYHHHVGVFDINPVVGHRTATKCWSKTCYRWSVSDARLVIYRQHAERAHKFLRQHARFIACRRGTQHASGEPAVNLHPGVVGFDKVRIAIRFHQAGDTVKGFIPADALPFIRARRAVFRVTQAVFTVDIIEQPRPFWAERAPADRMIRVPFDMINRFSGVLCAIAEAIH